MSDARHDSATAHSKNDRIVAKTADGDVVEGEWQTMTQLAKAILREAENHKTDLQKAKEISGAWLRVSCENCGITHEVEYERNLRETPQEHVEEAPAYGNDCSLDDVTVEAYCPRHGTIPLMYDECDDCADVRGIMNR